MRLPAGQASAFLGTEWLGLEKFFELRADQTMTTASAGRPAGAAATVPTAAPPLPANVEPAEPQFSVTIEGSLTQLGARMQANYPNKRIVTIGVTPSGKPSRSRCPTDPALSLRVTWPGNGQHWQN